MPKENKIEINLTSEEALVLFEFLSRFSEDEELSIQDSSEEQMLWNLLALLEKQLVEPFSKNYSELLEMLEIPSNSLRVVHLYQNLKIIVKPGL